MGADVISESLCIFQYTVDYILLFLNFINNFLGLSSVRSMRFVKIDLTLISMLVNCEFTLYVIVDKNLNRLFLLVWLLFIR